MTGTKPLPTEHSPYWRGGLRALLPLFLLMPYLIWLRNIGEWRWPPLVEWLPTLGVATVQASWSAAGAMGLGFALFLGALGWSTPFTRRLARGALLLPNMVPPLFLVLAMLSWVTPFAAFPYGFGAVVVAHIILNAGMVAIALEHLVESKLHGLAETAWTLGVSRRAFWRLVGWPILRADIACVFLFVFSICLTSFSIPLVLGGPRHTTLEVAIFDAIRVEGRWDKAVLLALCQSAFLFTLAWSLPRAFWPTPRRPRGLTYLALRSARGLVFIPALILVLGWLIGLGAAGAAVA